MKIKKKLFSRIARRKESTPPKPGEEGFDLPPPTAIEPGVPHSAGESEPGGYGPHIELLASDEPSRSDSTSGSDAEESGRHVVAEVSAALLPDDSPDDPEPPREVEAHREYGLEMEVLASPRADESPDEAEPPREDGETAPDVAESVPEDSASEPETLEINDGETTDGPAPAHEETAAIVAGSVDPPREEPDASPETPFAENGLLPLVKNSRGDWRPGKGFSRSELREAGLSPAGAARLRIQIDKRRRNAHPINVAALEKAKSGD